jgi:dihydroflavonol-4-reductase
VTVCITGGTGFIGAHVAKLAWQAGGLPRVTYRDEARLVRLGDVEVEPVKADVLDRGALRRAFRGCETVFHTAGMVGSRPAEAIWQINALSPRIVVEAAAAEEVGRVVVTSSVAGIGPAPPDRPGTEEDFYRDWSLGLTYPAAKHEGEAEALAAGARLGVEVVIVNPSYVFGPPIDRTQPAETSNRLIANYLRGRLPAVVDAQTNVVDVEDVAKGHLLAAERGRAGERYVLGGHDIGWVPLLERVAELSGIHHPVVVLPPEASAAARAAGALGLPGLVAPEGVVLMAQNWRYSSAKARRELGYRARTLDRTLRETIEWCLELPDRRSPASPMSLAAAGVRLAGRAGLLGGVELAERYLGRRLLVR